MLYPVDRQDISTFELKADARRESVCKLRRDRLRGIPIALAVAAIAAAGAAVLGAQSLMVADRSGRSSTQALDPAADATGSQLERDIHRPVPEEYIWTASVLPAPEPNSFGHKVPATDSQIEPHFFRRVFNVARVPDSATLYIAGPRWEKVWINGQLADEVSGDLSSPISLQVFATDVTRFLKSGRNLIAVEVVRGRGAKTFGDDPVVRQLHFGQLLAVKIVPAGPGIDAPPLLISDALWRSSLSASPGWELPLFDDADWQQVRSFGRMEGSDEMFQGNYDAGLYDWPGYDGISPFLAHKKISAHSVTAAYEGRSHFENMPALTGGSDEFTVKFEQDASNPPPNLLLDFGRELTGRLEIDSDADQPIHVSIQYGESEGEATRSPYLGVNEVTVGPHSVAHGAKSAFRYVKLQFLSGPSAMRFKSIHVDHIFYPVEYLGSFQSSDPELNRIWETGAYTAHLCMQDGIWDASKRDRISWSGDDDVSTRTINDVFFDHKLVEQTMDRLLRETPVAQHVNGIPGSSSYWLTQVAEYYRHTGEKEFLERTHHRAVQLLEHMDAEFDERAVYVNKTKSWVFVDWSPELNGDTPESRRATQFEFYRAYRDGAWLLREAGDTANATKYEQRAAAIKDACDKYLLDPATGTYGTRWQTNAMAVLSGVAGPERYAAIWNNVFSKVGHQPYSGLIISPYYNYYVISAMAMMGHREEALEWLRNYWGGMTAEGATSFWEGYDPSWYKGEFHESLQSDNRSGYFVSLAHGWSSGPTPWLMEQVLGIRPRGPGFSMVDIRPDLLGLAFARGAEPTPHGLLKVDVTAQRTIVDIPEGVTANISIPIGSASAQVLVNGEPRAAQRTEASTRATVLFAHPGHYTLESKE